MDTPFHIHSHRCNPSAARHHHHLPRRQHMTTLSSSGERDRSVEVSTMTKEAAAGRIKSACRGFLVRKNVRKVKALEKEAGEIERRMEESMDLALGNEKERLMVNEMLMSVLFRLDSVRGVRDYRKKVIRKVISLQEALDSLFAVNADEKTLEEEEEENREESVPSTAVEETPDDEPADSDSDFVIVESVAEEGRIAVAESSGGEKGVKEVMERMVEENEKLKGMVAELLERSGVQCRLMTCLLQRVENLERKVDHLGKKRNKNKRRKQSNSTGGGGDEEATEEDDSDCIFS